ncbi:MAG TPA: site-specific integrase [Saprospiraceae bacterium]|jgi:site-specific recombinase XerD|nr:site-specific integrase [Saprospiraceae bacterium]HMT72020.1 site-specific integrase [Saprospiraceae bacterium]
MKKLDFLKITFIIRKDRLIDGQAPIYLQLFLDSQRVRISINQKILVDSWDETHGRAKGNSEAIFSINNYLDKIRMDVMKIYNELKLLEDDITIELLKEKLFGNDEPKKKKLYELAEIYNSHTSKLIGIDLTKHTWDRYKAYAQKITEFIRHKFNIDDLYIHQLKYNFILEYDFYLKTEIQLHQNTIVKYVQYLNRVMDFAVNHEWADKNIFQNYKVSIKESKREYLSSDELNRIMDKEIPLPRLSEVRDCFVFCCYTGYAYKDAAELTPGHIVTGIDGKKWIYTSRQKTDNVSNVPLLEPALEIIEKYKNHPICANKNKLLPMKSNQKLNAYLKELADICRITKPMTMHIARHTFATTVLLANGVSMEATSKMLGHSSIKTTQIYGKIVERRVSDEMDKLSEKLFAPKKKDVPSGNIKKVK